jgi:hypothetical protein
MSLDERVARLEDELARLSKHLLQKTEFELEHARKQYALAEKKIQVIRMRYLQMDDLRIRIERLEERLEGFLPEDDGAA